MKWPAPNWIRPRAAICNMRKRTRHDHTCLAGHPRLVFAVAFTMKKTVILAALIVSATVAILYGVWAVRPVAEVYVAQRGTAISAVYGTAKVLSSLTMNVRARNTGTIRFADRITTNTVVGLVVTQGELLATISNEDLDREITKAETDLKAAEERRSIGPPSQQQLNTQEALLARLEK